MAMLVICSKCGALQDDPKAGESHYLTCPEILTPSVQAMLGLLKGREVVRVATKKTSKKPVKGTKKH